MYNTVTTYRMNGWFMCYSLSTATVILGTHTEVFKPSNHALVPGTYFIKHIKCLPF